MHYVKGGPTVAEMSGHHITAHAGPVELNHRRPLLLLAGRVPQQGDRSMPPVPSVHQE